MVVESTTNVLNFANTAVAMKKESQLSSCPQDTKRGHHAPTKEWHAAPDFVAAVAMKHPRLLPSYSEGATPKEREAALRRQIAISTSVYHLERERDQYEEQVRAFWVKVGRAMMDKGASQESIAKLKRRVRQTFEKQQQAEWKRVHGVVKRGTVAKDSPSSRFPFQSVVMRELPNPIMSFVPPLVTRRLKLGHIQRLRELEAKLKIVLRIRGGYKRDARDSNNGYSLGRTTVNGGTHSSKEDGIAGSLHMNRTLTGMSRAKKNECALRGVDADQLQEDIVNAITDVILCSFGKSPWFTASLDKLKDIPEIRFLPGHKIPNSHIWFTIDPEAFHVHTDTNTIPPAFLICVSEAKGGELCCLPPIGGPRVVSFEQPTIVAGAWAQYPHCNLPVTKGERHSFVVYMDHRNLAESYKEMIVKPLPQSDAKK